MNETLKKWAKTAELMPPANRPVRLEHNPVKTSLSTWTLPIPTRAIRRINRNGTRSRYISRTRQGNKTS